MKRDTSYSSCTLCPRRCGVDRTEGNTGFCGETDSLRLACATLHRGEEPPLVTGRGSGAVFFTGCTLGCRDCQNCQVSRHGMGAVVSMETLAEIMLRLQSQGAANINLVTGTHFIPSILTALAAARDGGLAVPVVWNTSGFESLRSLELLAAHIDVFLTDIKTLSPALAREQTGRPDYVEHITAGLPLMLKNRPLVFDGDRLVRGVLVRHLVIPGFIEESLDVVRWYGKNVGDSALFSLMTQFLDPLGNNGPEQGLSGFEFDLLQDSLAEADISLGYFQEMDDESGWLPDFSRENPFPEDYSRVVWHYASGFLNR